MTSVFLSKKFWIGTLERATKTFAQSAVALLTAEYASLVEIDIANLLGVSGLAAIVSILTRIAGADENTQEAIASAKEDVEMKQIEKIEVAHAVDWVDEMPESWDGKTLVSEQNELGE